MSWSREDFESMARWAGSTLLTECWRTFGGNIEDVMEAVQEAFLKLWEQQPQFKHDSDDAKRAWLLRTARHLLIDQFRRDKRKKSLERVLAELIAPAAETSDVEGDVRRALSKLPDVLKQVLELRFHAGLTMQEIANIQAVSVGTIHSRIYRGLRELRELLTEYEPG